MEDKFASEQARHIRKTIDPNSFPLRDMTNTYGGNGGIPGNSSKTALPPRRIQSAYNQHYMKQVRNEQALRGDRLSDAPVIAQIEK